MEWQAPDGSIHSATFDDRLDAQRASQRLRTALSLDGEWLPTVLRSAHERLTQVRREQPNAGGLVIAIDQEHARGIAGLLHARCGAAATVVTSDDPQASARIANFATGTEQWLVAVRMVSEGVDIPRLRVGVYATTTTTELFFRQAVGRFVRWTRGVARQRAWLYIPDDARLRTHAAGVAEQRRHSLRKDDAPERAEREQADGDDVQMSLFAALSAVATETREVDDLDYDPEPVGSAEEIELELAPPPPLAGGDPGATTLTRREHKQVLRDQNATVARELARRTRLTHGAVNAELNRLSGVRRVSEATIEQLEQRLRAGDKWLANT
jgi:superfamily II DNA or RNA helicase